MLVHGLLFKAKSDATPMCPADGELFLFERNVVPELCTTIQVEKELLD
jgi:hypothetical protein